MAARGSISPTGADWDSRPNGIVSFRPGAGPAGPAVFEFLRTNLDYVILVRSWLLISVALSARALAAEEKGRDWGLLGWFGLFQAAQAWIEIAMADHPPAAGLAWLHGGGFLLGAALAAAFAYRSLIAGGIGAGSRRWLALLLLVAGSAGLAAADATGGGDQALRMILVLPLAGAVWWRYARRRRQELPATQAASWGRRRLTCLGLLAVILAAGMAAASIDGGRQDAAMRGEVMTRARLAAAAVDPADLVSLQWSEADLGNSHYLHLKGLMRALRRSNADLRFALLAGLRAGRAYFIADNEEPSSPDYSPPGQYYEEAAPAYLQGMASRQPFLIGPVTDRWGTWIIASVPVADLPGRGAVNFELDLTAANWAAVERSIRLPIVLIALLFSALVIGSFEVQEHFRRQAAEMRTAKELAEAATRAKSDFLAVMSHEIRPLHN